MCGVRSEEPTAVRAEFFDGLLTGHGTTRDRLSSTGKRGDGLVTTEVLDDPAHHQHEGGDDGQRQQDSHHDPGQVDPETPQSAGVSPGQTAHQGHRHRDAHGGRQEVLNRECPRLRRVSERLPGVGLPVRVRDEADGGVHRLEGRHVAPIQGIGQPTLQPQHGEHQQDRGDREHDHRPQVHPPPLIPLRVHADQSIHATFNPEVPISRQRPCQIVAQGPLDQQQDHHEQQELPCRGHEGGHHRSSARIRA